MAPRLPGRLQVRGHGRTHVPRALLEQVVTAARRHCRKPSLPVSLLLCDDREIARLHGEFMGDPTPTDVITFDLDGTAEIAVSVQTARRHARARGTSLRSEVALYVVHGVLHACGHGDRTRAERTRMRTAERSVLAALGLQFAPVDE
jgi:probable rRNA maturation factor